MSYHWIMTVQWPHGNGYATGTFSGVTSELCKGTTRQEVYEGIFKEINARANHTNPNVLFFALEPNEL